MWFKNLSGFRFLEPFTLDAEAIAAQLAGARFRPCRSQQLASDGWVPPLGRKATDLVHAVNDCFLVCLQVEEKVLPASVVKGLLDEKVAEIEDREARSVRRREKERLRDELMLDLLPRALARSRQTFAYIDRAHNWLLVDSATPKQVEEVTAQLRECLGSLPIAPLEAKRAPAAVMSRWLKRGKGPSDFELDDECELRDGDGIVRCKGQELDSDEIRGHLTAGKQVTRLGLTWENRLSMVLGTDLLVRRLRFLDVVQEQVEEQDLEAEAHLFDAQFALTSGELRRFLPRLLETFGGETEQQ